jgi:hypothetical protein
MGTMTDACPQYRGDLAMAAVGRLGRSERKVLLRHSASCAGCRAALSELEATARMLPLVDPARLTDTGIAMDVSPSGGAGSRGNRGRRLRLRLVVPAVAAVAACALATAVIFGSGRPAQLTVSLRGAPGVNASAVLSPSSWGTEIDLHISGQPNGQVFTVAMESRSGSWWQAGSYRTAGGTTDVSLSCAAITSRIERILVRNSTGRIVLQSEVA